MSNPRVITSIIADDVRREDNGKLIVIGMYVGGITFEGQPPGVLRRIVFCPILKGCPPGQHEVSVCLQKVGEDSGVCSPPMTVDSIDEDEIGIAVFAINNLKFDDAGDRIYEVRLDGQVIHKEQIFVGFTEMASPETDDA